VLEAGSDPVDRRAGGVDDGDRSRLR
jgi:hypothetical protein